MLETPFPASPWTETAPPAPETRPLAGEAEADVAIVGAGLTGLSAALHLAERGVGAVVLEANEPGYGGSGRNGGQVVPGLKQDPAQIIADFGPERGEAIAEFAGRTADITFALIEKHGIDCDARRAGWLQGVHGRAALPIVERRAAVWAARGAPVEMIDGAEVERRSGARGYIAGFHDGRGGTVNPLALTRGLARAAIAAGASVHGASPVLSVRNEGGRWRVATATGAAVTAERVLLATNAYSDAIWPGLAESFIPVYSYQIATWPLEGRLRETLVPGGLATSDTRRLLSYCRQDSKGRLIVGGRGLFRESTSPADFVQVWRALARIFPEAAELNFDYRWGGRVAITLDHYPNIAELAPGLTAAVGYNGRGVALGTAVGQVIAGHLAGAPLESLPLPVRPFRPIPFHSLRVPAVALATHKMRLQDWWDARG